LVIKCWCRLRYTRWFGLKTICNTQPHIGKWLVNCPEGSKNGTPHTLSLPLSLSFDNTLARALSLQQTPRLAHMSTRTSSHVAISAGVPLEPPACRNNKCNQRTTGQHQSRGGGGGLLQCNQSPTCRNMRRQRGTSVCNPSSTKHNGKTSELVCRVHSSWRAKRTPP
jgi:hypothetical protein